MNCSHAIKSVVEHEASLVSDQRLNHIKKGYKIFKVILFNV